MTGSCCRENQTRECHIWFIKKVLRKRKRERRKYTWGREKNCIKSSNLRRRFIERIIWPYKEVRIFKTFLRLLVKSKRPLNLSSQSQGWSLDDGEKRKAEEGTEKKKEIQNKTRKKKRVKRNQKSKEGKKEVD